MAMGRHDSRLHADPAEPPAPVTEEPEDEEPHPEDAPAGLPTPDDPLVRPPGRRFLSFFLRLGRL
jgi:hypothetical protein